MTNECPLRLVQGVQNDLPNVSWGRLQPPCDPAKDKWLWIMNERTNLQTKPKQQLQHMFC